MRKLVSSPSFDKKFTKFLKKNFDLETKITKVFSLLQRDIHHPTLHTHRLSGKLRNYFSCSINYNFRLVFGFDDNFIYLYAIGAHDEVY